MMRLKRFDRELLGFCNLFFEKFTNIPLKSLLGTPFVDLLNGDSRQKFQRLWEKWVKDETLSLKSKMNQKLVFENRSSRAVHLNAVSLKLDGERLLILVFKEKEQNSGAIALIEMLNYNRVRLRNLEKSLNGMTPMILDKHPELIDELQQIDKNLKYIQTACSNDSHSAELHNLIVRVLPCLLEGIHREK